MYQLLIHAQELVHGPGYRPIEHTKHANEKLYRNEQLRLGIAAIKSERAVLLKLDEQPAGIISKLRLAFGRG